MYYSQSPWVELYGTLLEHDVEDAYSDLLEPWLRAHAPEEARWLAEFSRRTEARRDAATGEDLCRLYAAFRVTSTLLLRFQAGRMPGEDLAWPAITVEDFRRFHEALGFHVPEVPGFHPFFHEIVGVEQAPAADAAVEVVRQAWPALMLGKMMFCRAGCTVSGGTAHVVRDVAESSKLYWTFRRRDRPCDDLSHGWGGNSQWRTTLRRDYQVPGGFHYNVDAPDSLNRAGGTAGGIDRAVMVELVRNRCLVRSAVDDSDLYPYSYRYEERT